MTNETQPQEMTDGFHLIIDGLKLNGIDTIFGLPGIPITDFARKRRRPQGCVSSRFVTNRMQVMLRRSPGS